MPACGAGAGAAGAWGRRRSSTCHQQAEKRKLYFSQLLVLLLLYQPFNHLTPSYRDTFVPFPSLPFLSLPFAPSPSLTLRGPFFSTLVRIAGSWSCAVCSSSALLCSALHRTAAFDSNLAHPLGSLFAYTPVISNYLISLPASVRSLAGVQFSLRCPGPLCIALNVRPEQIKLVYEYPAFSQNFLCRELLRLQIFRAVAVHGQYNSTLHIFDGWNSFIFDKYAGNIGKISCCGPSLST